MAFHILLVTSQFHVPRASYIFDAVLAGTSVSVETVAAENCLDRDRVTDLFNGGDSKDVSPVNARTEMERLEEEMGHLRDRLVQDFLPNHIPGRPVPPLPQERLLQAIAEVEVMMEESRCGAKCPKG